MKNIKIAAFSDIHNVELWAKTFEHEFWPEVDVVIIAGDVCDNLPITSLDRFCLTHKEENLILTVFPSYLSLFVESNLTNLFPSTI